MDRTIRAALVAGLIGVVAVGGTASFLGIRPAPAVVSGLVAGLLFAGLILAAARRAQGFDDTPTPPRPRHPGPPPHREDGSDGA